MGAGDAKESGDFSRGLGAKGGVRFRSCAPSTSTLLGSGVVDAAHKKAQKSRIKEDEGRQCE